jgi:pimeloyl-ACP methyl ester carboxylesterase
MQHQQRLIRSDGVEIATEAFGDPADAPVLLIMGVMASMLWWPEDFCRQLAARGHFVIRYDNRDTGLSSNWGPGEGDYGADDMADDALRVLDGYGVPAAHIVGMSMGGFIAQRLALRRSGRVLSVTAISTSPIGTDTSSLPGATEAYMKHAATGEGVDWSDRTQVVDFIVRETAVIAGTAFPCDEAGWRGLVERDYDRARNFASVTNHFSAAPGEDLSGRLPGMAAPLLVMHGTADPLFPVEHGEALAAAVAGARMVRLEGGGHEIHPGHWDRIIAEIGAHAAQARPD